MMLLTLTNHKRDLTEIALSLLEPLLTCKRSFRKIHERVNEVPFDSDRKMMSTVHTYDEGYYSMTKGAIDKLPTSIKIYYFKNGKTRF